MRSLREHRLKWERMGLCSNCGGLKLEPQYKTCAKCRARSRENMRRIYEKVEYPTHTDPIDVKQEIRKDHKCWNCEWKRFEADRFFCPFAEGTCIKEGNILAADVVEEEKEETMKIDKVRVYGLQDSIKASKYPMSVDVEECNDEITNRTRALGSCDTGTGHDQFLTGCIVQFDLTFSIKAWVEAERYHFFDFVSSQSTMHRIAHLDPNEQCNEYVDKDIINILERKIAVYKGNPTPENYLRILYNVPVGFELTARMTTNYRQLKTIYYQRRNHRLPEWREFCKWVETLPCFYELCLKERETENAE